jgi:hypothetical protein
MDMLSTENYTTTAAVKAKLLLSLKHHAVKTYREWKNSPPIRNLGPVSFTPLPLYPQGNSLRHPLYKRPDAPQSRSGRYGEKKNHFSLLGIEP